MDQLFLVRFSSSVISGGTGPREQGWHTGESSQPTSIWPAVRSKRRHMWVGIVFSSTPCSERFIYNSIRTVRRKQSLCGCLTSKSLSWVENLNLFNYIAFFQHKRYEGRDLTQTNLKLQSRINIHWTRLTILCSIKGFWLGLRVVLRGNK